MSVKIYGAAIATILALAIGVAIWAGPNIDPAKTDIVGEIFKSSLQLAAVAIVGGLVGALYKGVQDRQTAKRQLDETRKDFLRKFRGIYFEVKKTRRLLSVAGLTEKFEHPPIELSDTQLASYREYMRALNALQLSLEDLNSEADICLCHHMDTREISQELRQMEQYLRSIVKEFERFGGTDAPDGPKISFNSLAELRIFTGHAKISLLGEKLRERSFNVNMSTPYWHVVKLIYTALAISAQQPESHRPRYSV
jgi:hypothetical protein